MTTMRVPFLDLGASYRRRKVELDEAVSRVLSSGYYVGGPEVDAFERGFAEAAGVPYAIGVANGTDAIALALRACGIRRDDHVVVPAVSAYPTTVGVLQAEATPWFVDVDASGLIDVGEVEEALRGGARAVVSVHLYGHCADVRALGELAIRYGAVLVEDCAQAHGAARDGIRAGHRGSVAAWSFYPTKNLGGFGDAGAVTASDPATADRLRRLRNYGQQNRYEHVERGFNSRLDPLQAAILSVKLRDLESDNQRRRTVAARYDDALKSAGGVAALPSPKGSLPNRHLYPVVLSSAAERTRFQEFLHQRGVETLIHYPIAMPDQKASDSAWGHGRAFPRARSLCSRVASLPCHPFLTDEQVETVIDALRAWWDGAA